MTIEKSKAVALAEAARSGDLNALGTILREVAEAGRVVVSTDEAALTLNAEKHGGRTLLYNDADGAITLPTATGSGVQYHVVIGTAATAMTITATGEFAGGVVGVDDDTDAAYAWKAEDDDDTISLDGTATGGKVYDWFRFTDVASGIWLAEGFITQSGGSEATPFSAA